MKHFVKEYAKYKKDLISENMSLSRFEKKEALNRIDRTLELCDCECIGIESAIRIILEV